MPTVITLTDLVGLFACGLFLGAVGAVLTLFYLDKAIRDDD